MYTLTRSDFVIRDSDGAHIPNDPSNTDRQVYEAWLALGNTPAPAAPIEEAEYTGAVQAAIDAAAAAKGYANGVSCASYAVSSNKQWQNEAQAFLTWRDRVWAHVYDELAEVKKGRAVPSVPSLIAGLPATVWPPEKASKR